MDGYINLFEVNANIYRNTLEQIIEKYSKLQECRDEVEIDLTSESRAPWDDEKSTSYIDSSEWELSKGSAVSEQSPAHHTSNVGQIDISAEDQDDNTVFTCDRSVQDNDEESFKGVSVLGDSQLTQSSLNETQTSLLSEQGQPEEQDKVLEESLSSHNSTLLHLYPSMLSKISQAWRRQQVADAADSVLRRYRQMRLSSIRRNMTNTGADTTLAPVGRNVKPAFSQTITFPQTAKGKSQKRGQSGSSPLVGTNVSVRAPQHLWTHHAGGKPSNRGRESKIRRPAILVMASSEPTASHDFSELDKTFSICDSPPSSPPGQEPAVELTPTRSAYLEAGRSATQPARFVPSREAVPSLPSHKSLTAVRAIVGVAPSIPECSRTCCSRVRESPFTRHHHASPTSLTRSPLAAPASPLHSVQKPASPLGSLFLRDSGWLTQSKLLTSLAPGPGSGSGSGLGSGLGSGRQHLQACLSLDASFSSPSTKLSSKQLDEEFKKVYRWFICRAQSPLLHNPHCRFCNSKVESEGRSSSTLAALALSPYHLKKRHRDLEEDQPPQAKRPRDDCFANSPGSLRQRKAMLRMQHRTSRFLSSTLAEGSSDSAAWSPKEPALGQERAMLQPPADRVRRAGKARFSLQFPVMKEEYNRFVRQYQGKSPEPSEWSGCPSSPLYSLSRRRLIYK